MVAGLSEEEKSTRLQPVQHFLHEGLQLFVTQIHQQPIGEDKVDTEEIVISVTPKCTARQEIYSIQERLMSISHGKYV